MKFQAIYRVTVYNQTSTIIIGAHIEKDKEGKDIIVQDEAQLTCNFTLTRGILSDSNKCTIRIYNLAPDTRSQIFMDAFQGWDQSKWKFVKLEAGYDGELSTIFMGRVLQAYSYRTGGQTDIITEIQAQALDMFDCQTSYTFEAGTTYKDAVKTIVATSMPNVKIGNIGDLKGEFKTPTTFDGSVIENINKIAGGNAFVDNDQLNILMSNEVIDVPVPVITPDNGLLDTPNRRDANLEVKMLFEPSLIVGQLLEIQSGVQSDFNGQYKVMGFSHDCMISGSQAGSRTTTVNLFIGPFLPGAELSLAEEKTNNFNKVKGEEISTVNPSNTQKWIMPCKGKISSPYGWRKSTNSNHTGIDIGVGVGTPVKAIASGNVILARSGISGYGNAIYIDHGIINGVKVVSEYGHLSSLLKTKEGQYVKQGQVIALSGGKRGAPGSGTSQDPHLHLTIRETKNGKTYPVPPSKYIKFN